MKLYRILKILVFFVVFFHTQYVSAKDAIVHQKMPQQIVMGDGDTDTTLGVFQIAQDGSTTYSFSSGSETPPPSDDPPRENLVKIESIYDCIIIGFPEDVNTLKSLSESELNKLNDCYDEIMKRFKSDSMEVLFYGYGDGKFDETHITISDNNKQAINNRLGYNRAVSVMRRFQAVISMQKLKFYGLNTEKKDDKGTYRRVEIYLVETSGGSTTDKALIDAQNAKIAELAAKIPEEGEDTVITFGQGDLLFMGRYFQDLTTEFHDNGGIFEVGYSVEFYEWLALRAIGGVGYEDLGFTLELGGRLEIPLGERELFHVFAGFSYRGFDPNKITSDTKGDQYIFPFGVSVDFAKILHFEVQGGYGWATRVVDENGDIRFIGDDVTKQYWESSIAFGLKFELSGKKTYLELLQERDKQRNVAHCFLSKYAQL